MSGSGRDAPEVVAVDLANATHGHHLLALLDHYARDPMGGGVGLAPAATARLLEDLRQLPQYHGALALRAGQAVGLINCLAGYSTFAARPLLNVHDIVVHRDHRSQGVGQALLHWAEARARALGCCKLTLEVLSGNGVAVRSYRQAGYAPYQLDPQAGQAILMQKWLD